MKPMPDSAISLHTQGIAAELNGSYAEARGLLEAAQTEIDALLNGPDHDFNTAAIARDRAFTDIREGLVTPDCAVRNEFFGTAEVRLRVSRQLLTKLLHPGRGIRSGLGTSALIDSDISETIASRGATLSCIARLATARGVCAEQREPGTGTTDYISARSDYRTAHNSLRRGGNGYYLVSNAMTAARQELLLGSGADMRKWLGRATLGLAWTALRDPGNLQAAIRTASSRMKHLRDRKTAELSVFSHP